MKVLQVFALCVSLGFSGSNLALACECRPESPNHAIKRLRKESTAIFAGTASDVTKEKDGYRATFIVIKWWKGLPSEKVTILTRGGCMAWFESGRTYLIYAATDSEGKLTTNVCMRTRLMKYATEDLKRLGKPK